MTRQDRDLLVVALITGSGILASLIGLGWATVNIATLIRTKETP